MGAGSSRLRKILTEEMDRVRTVERKPGESPALKLTEILNFTPPGDLEQYVELNHPAVLWVLDADKDGMFGEEDIHSFAWMMGEYTKDWPQYQWRNQIKGFCYMQLYDRVLSNDGAGGDSVQNARNAPQWLKDLEATRPPVPDDPKNPAAGTGMPAFQAWMEMVIEENSPRTFDHDDFPGTVYVERDTMHDLYCMFQVNKCWGTFGERNFQDFLTWLQNDAEVKGLLPLDDDELDDFVPMETVRDMVEDIMRGYRCVNVHVNTE